MSNEFFFFVKSRRSTPYSGLYLVKRELYTPRTLLFLRPSFTSSLHPQCQLDFLMKPTGEVDYTCKTVSLRRDTLCRQSVGFIYEVDDKKYMSTEVLLTLRQCHVLLSLHGAWVVSSTLTILKLLFLFFCFVRCDRKVGSPQRRNLTKDFRKT